MSFVSKDPSLVSMSDKIAFLEQALRQIADAKKQLYRNTTEVCNVCFVDSSTILTMLRK